jgi:hypothetical protein
MASILSATGKPGVKSYVFDQEHVAAVSQQSVVRKQFLIKARH